MITATRPCLLLLVTALFFTATAQPVPPAQKRFLITDSGAVADGQTVNTKAIQTAIDRCAADGGGVVVVPPGTFLTGAIFLKQGVNLRVEKDAILKGSTSPQDYKMVQTRWEGIEREWICALINGNDLNGVELSGEGLIDGQGTLYSGGQRGAQADPAVPRITGRPRLIVFQNCKQVRVTGLNIKDQACWGVTFIYCDGVVAEGLTIRAVHTIPSSDGLDVDSSRNVRIAKCDIDCNDDCISIKSGKDDDGRRVNRPCEDVIIENCRFGYGHGGVAMGSETTGGIRNVEVRNCIFEDGNWAPIRFKSQPSRGGVVENITYRDLQIRNTRQMVEFNMEWRMVPPIAPPAKVLPVVKNVKIIGVTGTAATVGTIHGLKDSPILGVTFEKCEITAPRGLTIENARDVDITGLKITVTQGDPVTRRNAE